MGLASFNRLRREREQEAAQAEKQKPATTAPAEPESAADSERDALAAEYEERFGKKPGRMNTETIRDKLEAAGEDGDQ